MDGTASRCRVSTTGPGADLVDGAEGIALARETNDYLAQTISRIPRFAGFAHLPMRDLTRQQRR